VQDFWVSRIWPMAKESSWSALNTTP
jgi:hypothetical protein